MTITATITLDGREVEVTADAYRGTDGQVWVDGVRRADVCDDRSCGCRRDLTDEVSDEDYEMLRVLGAGRMS